MLGPLAAFAVLAVAPLAFDAVFVVSFCVALIGFTILVLFVENSPSEGKVTPDVERVSVRDALGLLATRRFQGLVVSGAALALFTISDGFLYLAIQRHFDLDERFLPLLFTGTALVYMLLAIPVGRIADRLGRRWVFVGGYVLLLPVYGSLLLPAVGMAVLPLYLLLVGCTTRPPTGSHGACEQHAPGEAAW